MSTPFTHVNALTDVAERAPTYLAVGSFDGVHRGHQHLLRALVAAARRDGARAAALTFFPHPRRFITGQTDRYYLTTPEARADLIAALGVDLLVTLPFDDAIRHTRAADFVQQLLDHVGLAALWGGSFALGYKREGDLAFLQKLGAERGFAVRVVDGLAELNGRRVSSSRIREALGRRDLAEANACLGRPYRLSGPVVLGAQRGRTIGFPTANLKIWSEQVLPGHGVYATEAWVGDRRYVAATNVGVRPTVDGLSTTVEAHLLDFDGDLYGETLHLDFMVPVRPEQKFESLDALQAQIAADVTAVRATLTPASD